MSFFAQTAIWFSRYTRRSAHRRKSIALMLERLEDRTVPSTVAAPDLSVTATPNAASPMAGSANGPYTPTQIRHAYGFDQITFNNGAVQGDGSGQTIAIIDAYDDPNISSDLNQFDQRYGLPAASLSVVRQTINGQPPSTDPTGGWELEESLDVEWAHAMAPGAKILLVEANAANTSDLFNAVQWAASQPGVSVVSMSWGSSDSSPYESGYDSTFTTPAGHPGVTFVASSGDSGDTSYPATSPNVLAVGGTSLSLDSSGNYRSESAWNGSGGGISANESEPSYQQGVQSTGYRGSPDVAYDASPSTGFSVYDSFDRSTPWVGVGGTSAGAPQWAALVAIANQGRALNGQGSLDGPSQTLPMLYNLPSSDFHDVTSGSNSSGYSAGSGYDFVTGLGSPHADRIVAALSGQSAAPSSIVPTPAPTAPPSNPSPSPTPTPTQPAPTPPTSPTPTPTPDPYSQIAAEAMAVAWGLEFGNYSIAYLGLVEFETLLNQAPADQQAAMQQAFLNDIFADLF